LGQPYAELQTDTASLTVVKRYQKLTGIMRIFWKKLVQELSTHFRQYNTWIEKTRGVKLGDIALLLDPKKRGLLPLVRITQVQRGLDSRIRRVTVWDGHSEFSRAITSLAVLVPAKDNVNKPEADAQASAAQTIAAQATGAQASGAQGSGAQASGLRHGPGQRSEASTELEGGKVESHGNM
jgi:hypothetical protein